MQRSRSTPMDGEEGASIRLRAKTDTPDKREGGGGPKYVIVSSEVEMSQLEKRDQPPNNDKGNGTVARPRGTTTQEKPKKGTNIFAKKARTGDWIRGARLGKLVSESGLTPTQVQALASEFVTRIPDGKMTEGQFKKELQFDGNDDFGGRLFRVFCKQSLEYLTLDEFILGISCYAPRAKLDAKIDICYEMFDVDKNGTVSHDEFTHMATYSLRQARVGVDEGKLRQLIDAEWAAIDVDGDGEVTKKEFQQHMLQNKEFVNALTIHVPWVQAAFRKAEVKSIRRYLDTEPMISVLADVAMKVGAKADEASKWSATLKDNYFSDVSSLKEITNDDWTAMQLPRRLYSIMMQALDNNTSSEGAISNRVSRKVLKMHSNLAFQIRRKRLVIIWILIYLMGMAGLVIYTFFKYMTDRVGEQYYEAYLLLSPSFIVSRVFGAMLKLNFSLMLLPVCYRTLTWMRTTKFDHYIPIDSLMFFHRYVGASLLFYGLAHATGHFVNFYNLTNRTVDQINNVFGPGFVTATPTYASLLGTRSGATGMIMICSMLLMVPLARESFRRSRFNVFFSVHHLYILIYICLPLHDGWLFGNVEIIYWILPSLLLFIIERIITITRGSKTYAVLDSTVKHKGDVLELRMEKPAWFDYSAGHYTWINCPVNSRWEWHPFTLTSSPDQEYISVNINLVGDWTKAMGELCGPTPSPNGKHKNPAIHNEEEEAMSFLPRVRIDGPYGTASGDVFMFSHVILIGGGIGVTPFVSILKSISYNVRCSNHCSLQGVHFIWVAKSQENFEWFVPILAEMMEHEDLRGFFKVSIYLTGTRHAINDIRLLGMSMLIKRAKTTLGEDLVTGLEASTTFGRPDFQKIFLQANNEWAGNKIGVFFCGPAPLAASIKVTCAAINKANRRGGKESGAVFNFQQEFF